MLLENVMAERTGQAWAKACYMAGVGYQGGSQEQPWATTRAWNEPDAGQDRPSRKEATCWLPPSGSSSRSALFPDGRGQVKAAQQQLNIHQQQMQEFLQQQQQQRQHNPDDESEEEEATDFVFIMKKNPQGCLEVYCETCNAWCGDDPKFSGHLASAKHKSWEDHFAKQKACKESLLGSKPATTASVGTPSYGCCGPPQRSFVFGPGAVHADVQDFVTHEDLQLRFDQLRSCGLQAEKLTEASLQKLSKQQQYHIAEQNAMIAELRKELRVIRATVGEMQDVLLRELA